MISCKNFNINGLEIRGDEPLSPRTLTFLRDKKINVKQEGGRLEITGSFSISRSEVEEFLAKKAKEDAENIEKNANTIKSKL